jgi:peptidoglycan/xylan/chitin deacetylase (PgdA/CDA1 family)
MNYLAFRRMAKQIARSAQAFGYLSFARGRRTIRSPLVRVLCYHSVSRADSASFRRQMQWLASRYCLVPIDQVVAIASGNQLPTQPKVAISFDDGFRDNFDVAAPTLRELGLPATFFIITAGRAENSRTRDESPDGPDESWPARLFMTWDEVRQLADQGFDIGLHAHLHHDQAHFSTAALRTDLATGAALIHQHTGRAPLTFAWPFGQLSNRHAELPLILRELGIPCAFSGVSGNNLPGTDPYSLFRDGVDPAWPPHVIEAMFEGMLDRRAAS